MDYRDTRSSSRAQLKAKGKKRNNCRNWVFYWSNRGRRSCGGKGMKIGRANAGGALRRGIGIEEGLDDDATFDDLRIETSESLVKEKFVEEYEIDTERYLQDRKCALCELLERLDRGERFEGSSVCDSREEWLSEIGEGFEMLDLFAFSSSGGSISDDGWAVVPEAG